MLRRSAEISRCWHSHNLRSHLIYSSCHNNCDSFNNNQEKIDKSDNSQFFSFAVLSSQNKDIPKRLLFIHSFCYCPLFELLLNSPSLEGIFPTFKTKTHFLPSTQTINQRPEPQPIFFFTSHKRMTVVCKRTCDHDGDSIWRRIDSDILISSSCGFRTPPLPTPAPSPSYF